MEVGDAHIAPEQPQGRASWSERRPLRPRSLLASPGSSLCGDELIAAAYRAQADALEIESRAKRRLADEYDAAQERGEVSSGRPKSLPDGNTSPTVADIGLSSKQVHDARLVRDAEKADAYTARPGSASAWSSSNSLSAAAGNRLERRSKSLSLALPSVTIGPPFGPLICVEASFGCT